MTFRTFVVSLLSLTFGLVYPSYGSVAAIQTNTGEDDTHWLIYWLIFSLLTIVENVAWPVLKWIPLYNEVKVAVLAWLVLPQTKGALWVYESLLAPALIQARKELRKFPALEKAMTSIDRSAPLAPRTEAQNASEISQRQIRLSTVVKDVTAAFDASLSSIAGIADGKARVDAEKSFDKDLNKLSKIASVRQNAKASKTL